MSAAAPEFRLGAVLATSFTATLTERRGTPLERMPTPQRLVDWMRVSDLAVPSCSTAQLGLAVELREAIHLSLTAVASGEPLPTDAVQNINLRSRRGRAAAMLTEDGHRQWRLEPGHELEDALGVIATDAIGIISGERDGRVALCASPTCRAAFFDTSRSRTRTWCDMNTCGNRQKKARFKASHA